MCGALGYFEQQHWRGKTTQWKIQRQKNNQETQISSTLHADTILLADRKTIQYPITQMRKG